MFYQWLHTIGILLFIPTTLFASQWIVRLDSKTSTERLLRSSLLVQRFGSHRQFALVRNEVQFRKYFPKERLQKNFVYRSCLDRDPFIGKSWGLHNIGQKDGDQHKGTKGIDIHAPAAWAVVRQHARPIVAVIDSGVDLNHEDLHSALWVNPREIASNGVDDDKNGHVDDIHGWNFVADNADLRDDQNHGTLVSGIIGATAENRKGSRGVATAHLMVLKATDKFGVGTTQLAIEAITYAVKQGATIINASWGGTHFDPALYETIRWAGERGVLFVAAAGNSASSNDQKGATFPAAFDLPNLIAVAAYDNRNGLWDRSNYGKESVHLGAPGVSIFGPTVGGYGYQTGTSFAAPFVTGVAALVKAQVPSMDPRVLKRRLVETSSVIHYYEKERLASAGRVNAYFAVKGIRPPRPQAPSDWERYPKTVESPHPYLNDMANEYLIRHEGASHLRVHLKRLSVEPKVDRLELYDSEGRFVWAYTGSQKEFWSVDVIGDELTLRLVSDYVTTGYGFAVDAYEVSTAPTRWSKGQQSKRHFIKLGRFFRRLLESAPYLKELVKARPQ